MKKTISINIGGLSFIIEEEAYDKLHAYLESIKKHYALSDQEEEILNDIEANIAEKFSARTGVHKEVITLADVEEIIRVMGTVKEITEEEEAEEPKKETVSDARKKLYRDTDDVVIAGVASGLAAYFGIDPVFVRILFVVLIFANGIGILLYLLLWVAMPKAMTGTQKLEMRGKPVNVSEITQAVKEKSKLIGSEGSAALERISKNPAWYRILNFPIRLIERIFNLFRRMAQTVWPVAAIISGLMAIGFALAGLIGLSIALGYALFNIGSPFITSDLPLKELAADPIYWIEAVSIYLVFAIPVIFLFFLGTTLFFRRNTFRPVVIGVLLSVWTLAVIAAAVVAGNLVPRYQARYQEIAKAETIVRNYDYKDFSKFYLGADIDAKIMQGEKFSITLTGRGADLDRMRFDIENGQLQLKKENKTTDKMCVFCYDQAIKAEITMPKLDSFVGIRSSSADIDGFKDDIYISVGEANRTKIKLYGQKLEASIAGIDSDLEITGSSSQADLKLIGNARLSAVDFQAGVIKLDAGVFSEAELEGQADELDADLKGDASLAAFGLKADKAVITAKGDADAEVWAVTELNAYSADMAKITYKDKPGKLEKQVADDGVVVRADWEVIEENGRAPITLKIETDADVYSPAMSSLRGIGLVPAGADDGRISYYVWRTDNGRLVSDWESKEKTQSLKIQFPAEKIYWTILSDDDSAITGASSTNIFLEAYDNNDQIAGNTELTLLKQKDGSFRVESSRQ